MNTQPIAAAVAAAAVLVFRDNRAAARLAALDPKSVRQCHRFPTATEFLISISLMQKADLATQAACQ